MKRILPELEHCPAKNTANCAKCGEKDYKQNMTSLHARKGSYSTMRKLCHVCDRCLAQILDELAVSMPE